LLATPVEFDRVPVKCNPPHLPASLIIYQDERTRRQFWLSAIPTSEGPGHDFKIPFRRFQHHWAANVDTCLLRKEMASGVKTSKRTSSTTRKTNAAITL
jgi:hypothetical protein